MKVNATGVVTAGSAHLVAVSRLVRVSAMTAVAVLFVAYIAVQAFATHYNAVPSTRTVVAQPATNTALAAAISEQVARGLTCREEPALTDTILFQAVAQSEVQVLTFEQAIAASSAREGWIRRYCF
ncbi:hypothetical protein [Aeromicrobium sp.]|uniref:hypothetical protein n=1 Tax=Aeromicrobium sp. TaxID=1871063 RepID=UPI002FC71486